MDFRVQHLETLESKAKASRKIILKVVLSYFLFYSNFVIFWLTYLFIFFLVTFQPPQQLPSNAKKPLLLFVNCFWAPTFATSSEPADFLSVWPI